MTAITFPNSPSSGDTHTAGNGIVYTYDGEKWTSIGTNSAGTWTRSGTEVSLTNAGDDLNVDNGTLFVDASTDRVGIGTTSPGKLLALQDSSTPALGFYTGTTLRAEVNATSAETSILSYANSPITFNIGGSAETEAVRIDSSGRLLVGTSTSATTLTTSVEIHSAGTGISQPAFQAYSFPGTAANNCAYYQLFRSRGSSVGTNTIVASGDRLGMLRWSGANGTEYDTAAEIYAEVDGTPGASTNMPGRLVFSTTAAGANNTTERVSIGSNGALKLLAGCPGIDFSGIQTNSAGMTSETLENYEQGTFTPILQGSFLSGTYVAGRTTTGRYIRIGNMVAVTVDFNDGNFSGSTGGIVIAGLPFSVSNLGQTVYTDIPYESFAAAMMYNVSFNTSYRQSWYLIPNSSSAAGIESRSGSTWLDWLSSDFHNSSIYFTQTFIYTTA